MPHARVCAMAGGALVGESEPESLIPDLTYPGQIATTFKYGFVLIKKSLIYVRLLKGLSKSVFSDLNGHPLKWSFADDFVFFYLNGRPFKFEATVDDLGRCGRHRASSVYSRATVG